jgi:DNA polymerase III sliding clamp (beta) subunit (PCNA family)
MHPITLPVAELKPALAGLGKVVNSRTSLAILTNIKIERTADGWIALTGTDLDRFVTVRLEHPAEGPPATVLVPYEQLVQITKNCGKDEQIQLAHSAQGPVIKFALAAQLGETKVIHVPVEEFPITPQVPRMEGVQRRRRMADEGR